ncbi:MAG TPA: hypothetical protein DCQ06_01120 [Myxococcales bacterium]|nr:hypothetical protein [Myxococcales bacterium]HAN30174.1 hypothetical protein [Myxococcales bacterium]
MAAMTAANQIQSIGSLDQATPRLIDDLTRQRNEDNELVLVAPDATKMMTVRAHEEPLIDLIDGQRGIETLARAGLKASPPVRPMATLGLLRRLHVAGMIDGLEAIEDHLVATQPARFRQLSAALDRRVSLPFLGRGLALGRKLPPGVLTWLPKIGAGVFVIAMLIALGMGRHGHIFAPLRGDNLPTELMIGWCALALSLSWRGLWRGISFSVLQLPLPNAALRWTCGIIHADIDDKDRRSASREQRLRIASTGLAAVGLLAGVSSLLWLFVWPTSDPLKMLCAAATYVLLADAAPYGRGSGWHLIGITTGIPDLRRRSTAFLLRRTLRNLQFQTPIKPLEQTYIKVACIWLVHGLISMTLLVWYFMPGTLRAMQSAARIEVGGWFGAAIALMALLLLVLAGLLVAGLLAIFGGAFWQMTRTKKAAHNEGQRIGVEADILVTELRKVPFLAALPDDDLTAVIAGMRRESHVEGAMIVQQGQPGDRFCYLHGGSANVMYEEESGLEHKVASLSAGDFFGEVALLETTKRTATVIATESCEVLTLDRETFVALVERSKFAREAILEQVRNAAFLRKVRVFTHLSARSMSSLLKGVEVLRLEADEKVVQEGDEGDSMFVIREGTCRVSRTLDSASELEISELSSGDWFGEIAVLRGMERTATVVTTEPCVLIQVPAETLDALLVDDLETGLALEQTVATRLVALEAR